MCFPCLFCLFLYLHLYCTCFLDLNFDLSVLYAYLFLWFSWTLLFTLGFLLDTFLWISLCSFWTFAARRDPERGLQSWFRPAKPETRNRLLKLVSNCETRNPKPETDSESGFQSTKPETRNPKPTRIRLLGGSPDRNSLLLSFWNQDSYSWLKLPIFGCILYNLEPWGHSPWWYFPIVKTCFPFLEQCGQYLTCDCYMLEKEFGNHPLHALRRNLLSFH